MFKRIQIIRSIIFENWKNKSMFSDHNGIKLGSQQQKEIWKITKYLKAK